MKAKNWNVFGGFGLVPSLLFGVAMSLTPLPAADGPTSGSEKLVGTWFTQVSIRECKTGVVLRAFPAINTFNSGETMMDTTTGVSPSLRSPGQGKWEKTGLYAYSATSLSLLFSSTGAWTGTQKLTHAIAVNGDENAFTSTVEIFDTSGIVISTGCATAVGHRL